MVIYISRKERRRKQILIFYPWTFTGANKTKARQVFFLRVSSHKTIQSPLLSSLDLEEVELERTRRRRSTKFLNYFQNLCSCSESKRKMETFHSNQSVFISVGATGGQRVIRVVVVIVVHVVVATLL